MSVPILKDNESEEDIFSNPNIRVNKKRAHCDYDFSKDTKSNVSVDADVIVNKNIFKNMPSNWTLLDELNYAKYVGEISGIAYRRGNKNLSNWLVCDCVPDDLDIALRKYFEIGITTNQAYELIKDMRN